MGKKSLCRKKLWVVVFLLLWGSGGVAAEARMETILVTTKATKNQQVTFYVRVPENYDSQRRDLYRILVLFGGRNSSGKEDATGRLGWGEWADQLGIFLVCPGFIDDEYWDPEEWSGKALFKALSELKKNYRVCTTKLLYYGYSAGSQCANLFAAWQPSQTRAWVSHACGVFHEPTARMRNVPGLVTCGDADTARYVISRNFVEESRRRGIPVIWKSFPNHPHDVPPDSLTLARAFLRFYHQRSLSDLSERGTTDRRPTAPAYIGDDQENRFYEPDSPKARNILPEDRVELPSRAVAEAWGKGEL